MFLNDQSTFIPYFEDSDHDSYIAVWPEILKVIIVDHKLLLNIDRFTIDGYFIKGS